MKEKDFRRLLMEGLLDNYNGRNRNVSPTPKATSGDYHYNETFQKRIRKLCQCPKKNVKVELDVFVEDVKI